MTIKAEPYTHDPLYSDSTYIPEEKREYEKMYEATTGKVSHKIMSTIIVRSADTICVGWKYEI